jgi:hypothetical protein
MITTMQPDRQGTVQHPALKQRISSAVTAWETCKRPEEPDPDRPSHDRDRAAGRAYRRLSLADLRQALADKGFCVVDM